MSETVIDDVSIAASSDETGSFGKPRHREHAILVVDGDSNSTDLTVEVNGVAVEPNGTPVPTNITQSVGNFDATGGRVLQLTGLEGVGRVQVLVTNNASSSTTVTITNPDH